MKKKTIFFEDKYGVDIKDFSTTKEIDEFIDKCEGRKLKVVRIRTNIL